MAAQIAGSRCGNCHAGLIYDVKRTLSLHDDPLRDPICLSGVIVFSALCDVRGTECTPGWRHIFGREDSTLGQCDSLTFASLELHGLRANPSEVHGPSLGVCSHESRGTILPLTAAFICDGVSRSRGTDRDRAIDSGA